MNRSQGWTMGFVISAVLWCLIISGVMCVAGCQRGDIKITPVIQGQVAPHDGYNIGPETWKKQGDPINVTGALIWIKGTDPNELTGL